MDSLRDLWGITQIVVLARFDAQGPDLELAVAGITKTPTRHSMLNALW
jgi:hypothetical protein